jgi:hypothetical protein
MRTLYLSILNAPGLSKNSDEDVNFFQSNLNMVFKLQFFIFLLSCLISCLCQKFIVERALTFYLYVQNTQYMRHV